MNKLLVLTPSGQGLEPEFYRLVEKAYSKEYKPSDNVLFYKPKTSLDEDIKYFDEEVEKIQNSYNPDLTLNLYHSNLELTRDLGQLFNQYGLGSLESKVSFDLLSPVKIRQEWELIWMVNALSGSGDQFKELDSFCIIEEHPPLDSYNHFSFSATLDILAEEFITETAKCLYTFFSGYCTFRDNLADDEFRRKVEEANNKRIAGIKEFRKQNEEDRKKAKESLKKNPEWIDLVRTIENNQLRKSLEEYIEGVRQDKQFEGEPIALPIEDFFKALLSIAQKKLKSH